MNVVPSVQVPTEPRTVSFPGVDRIVERIKPLAAAPGMQDTSVCVFTDVRLMGGQGNTVYADIYPYLPHCRGSASNGRFGLA